MHQTCNRNGSRVYNVSEFIVNIMNAARRAGLADIEVATRVVWSTRHTYEHTAGNKDRSYINNVSDQSLH